MKRMIAVVCAALCLTAALSACGKKEEAQIDLQKVYEAILDAQELFQQLLSLREEIRPYVGDARPVYSISGCAGSGRL